MFERTCLASEQKQVLLLHIDPFFSPKPCCWRSEPWDSDEMLWLSPRNFSDINKLAWANAADWATWEQRGRWIHETGKQMFSESQNQRKGRERAKGMIVLAFETCTPHQTQIQTHHTAPCCMTTHHTTLCYTKPHRKISPQANSPDCTKSFATFFANFTEIFRICSKALLLDVVQELPSSRWPVLVDNLDRLAMEGREGQYKH